MRGLAVYRAIGLTLVGLSLIVAAGVARAEEQAPPLPPADSSVTLPGDPSQLPEVPETTVVGRPGSYPSQPLPPDTAVSPTKTETPLSEIGTSVTVITKEQIAETKQNNVAEVLRDVPGLEVVRQGPPGGITSVFIRGAPSGQTKVLIDGIPANDPSSASRAFDFSTLSVDDIEQIEVLRGPQSMLYGSDAIGGVVNIITKRGQGPLSVKTSVMGGSYGTARESLSASGGTDKYYYSFGGSYLQTDGFSAAASGTELDGNWLSTFTGRYGWTPTEDFNVDYVFRYINQCADIDDAGFGNGALPTDNPIRKNITKTFFNRVQPRLMLFDGFWEQKVGFSYTSYDRRDTDAGLFGVPVFLGATRKVDYQSNFFLAEWNTFTVGTDYQQEDAVQYDPFLGRQPAGQNDAGIYFQDQISLGERWFTTVGCRWDDNSYAGPASTYRITTRYILQETNTAFHGSIGTGFRAPSLAENAFAFGNKNLKPEESKGWDCGIEQAFGEKKRFVVDTTYFRNDFVNLIQFNPATYTLENIGRAFSSGVELTSRYALNECTGLRGTYVYTFTEDLATGLPLRRRAPHMATVGVDRRFAEGRGNVYANLLYVSPRLDSTDDSIWLHEYYLLNVAASYDLNKHWQVFGRIDNLLNQRYQEVYGYATPLLSFYGGVNLTF